MLRRLIALVLPLISALCLISTAQGADPNVRAITAFVQLDATRYEAQLKDTIAKLRQAQSLMSEAGYPVQTLRITTQPFMTYIGTLEPQQQLAFLMRLQQLAQQAQVGLNIGPAVLDDQPDARAIELLQELGRRESPLFSTMLVASDKGVHWNTVRAAARHVKRLSAESPRSEGTFNFATLAMTSPGSPFFPGSYHLNEGGRFSVGLESANVVADVFAKTRGNADAATKELTAALSKHASRVHEVAKQIEQRTGMKYWGLDPTPAPLKDVSIGAAMESFIEAPFGSVGTLTAAYTITRAVRSVPGPHVGYAGLMLPVLEDSRIAQRWSEGRIDMSALLAYSAVCGTGLDTVPVPGDVSEDQLARIIGDVAVLAFKWNKPLTARLQPVHGKKAGERSEFIGQFLVNAKLQPLL